MPRPITPRFSSVLDCFRWVAAALVCIAHVRSVMFADFSGTAGSRPFAAVFYGLHGFGHQAVIVFFVLSGYLIGGEVLRGLRTGNFDWITYAIRRWSRLYPVYVAALLLGLLWDNLGLRLCNLQNVYNHHGQPFPMIFYPVAERLTATVLGGNLLFLQGIAVPTLGSNTPLWSLANEAWYYALFPLALWPLFGKSTRPTRVLCFAFLVGASWLLWPEIAAYFLVWLAGTALHFIPRRLPVPGWLPPLLLTLLLGPVRLHQFAGWSIFVQDLAIAVILLLWLNQLEHRSGKPAPAARWHHRLAGFSYTLYLVHWPLALFLAAALGTLAGRGYRMEFGAGAFLLYGAVLAVVYAFAWLLAQLIEQRTTWLRGRLFALIPARPPS